MIKSFIAVVCFAIALSSCGDHSHSDHDHDHEHTSEVHSSDSHSAEAHTSSEHQHNEPLELTSYSDDFEVYAVAKPFALGRESDIIAHISHLSNFKPLASASVTACLVVGDSRVEQTLDKPTHLGVYKFHLTPATVGAAQLVYTINQQGETSRVVVENLMVYEKEHAADHAAEEAVLTSGNGASFTKSQSWMVDFATEVARVEPFTQVIKSTAQILPSQGGQCLISAKTSGVVTLSSDRIVDGQPLAAGQLLMTIESSSMADNNMTVLYNQALNQYQLTEKEYLRKKALAQDNIVSENELLLAKTDFDNAKAQYDNLRENFSESGQSVKSPITGFIAELLVRNGQYVEAGAPLASVAADRNLLIRANVQPRYYSSLSHISGANISVMGSGSVYSLEELGGSLLSYGRSVDLTNALIPVIFQVENRVDLLQGSFVDLYIHTTDSQDAVTVANEALIEEMGNFFVYRQLTPIYFEKTAVEIGVTDGVRTQIVRGLSGGERVVSQGAILVKLAQASGALEPHAGHSH